MKNETKTRSATWKWLGAALLAVAGLAGRASAGQTTAYLNIDVTISGSKSVSVNTVASSTDSTSVNWTTTNQVVVGGTVTVQHTSGVLAEGWYLSTNGSSLNTGGQSWTLAGSSVSVPAEKFSIQAVIGSSNTTSANCANATWYSSTIAPLLTTSLVAYTSGAAFADTAATLNSGGASATPDSGTTQMYSYNAGSGIGMRALCWQLRLPASTIATATQNIQVIVTAY